MALVAYFEYSCFKDGTYTKIKKYYPKLVKALGYAKDPGTKF